ncbi:MAG: response regulator [Candidatus Krumholzibacteriia bacterium]
MKLLVVDDSKAMRMIIKRTLRQAGWENCEVDEAENGVEALAKIKVGGYDLVLSDWNMPELNGIDLLEAMKAEGIATPFGFVTTEGTPEMRDRARKAGALFLIAKPFTAETFQHELRVVMA